HPSALEPYGGANTGIGGVIRDPMGTGLGAKPICNTDVFCFAPPDTSPAALPPGVLHPRRVAKGGVWGVLDYGNRMCIPTANGAVVWLDRAPVKYHGLSYTEIWISEAQERMVLSVPPCHWEELSALCRAEGVEATIIGQFVPTGRLELKYDGQQVADLPMQFL